MRDNGVPVTSVKDYTGSKEILNGRVKTLHPKIHGGILAVRGNQEHEKDMENDLSVPQTQIDYICLIYRSLYYLLIKKLFRIKFAFDYLIYF